MRPAFYSLNKCEKTEQICRLRRCRLPGRSSTGSRHARNNTQTRKSQTSPFARTSPAPPLDPFIEQTTRHRLSAPCLRRCWTQWLQREAKPPCFCRPRREVGEVGIEMMTQTRYWGWEGNMTRRA